MPGRREDVDPFRMARWHAGEFGMLAAFPRTPQGAGRARGKGGREGMGRGTAHASRGARRASHRLASHWCAALRLPRRARPAGPRARACARARARAGAAHVPGRVGERERARRAGRADRCGASDGSRGAAAVTPAAGSRGVRAGTAPGRGRAAARRRRQGRVAALEAWLCCVERVSAPCEQGRRRGAEGHRVERGLRRRRGVAAPAGQGSVRSSARAPSC